MSNEPTQTRKEFEAAAVWEDLLPLSRTSGGYTNAVTRMAMRMWRQAKSTYQGLRQTEVADWLVDTFGPAVAADQKERMYRFGEEACELVQAMGGTKEEMLALVEYVYNRPVGEVHQEVGGVMITLAALCSSFPELDLQVEGKRELDRILNPEVQDKIRAKQVTKELRSRNSEIR